METNNFNKAAEALALRAAVRRLLGDENLSSISQGRSHLIAHLRIPPGSPLAGTIGSVGSGFGATQEVSCASPTPLRSSSSRRCTIKNSLGNAVCLMTPDMARHHSSASGVAHQHGVLQIERFHQLDQILHVGVHVISLPGLAGPPMASTIMRHAAVASRPQSYERVLLRVCARPNGVIKQNILLCKKQNIYLYDLPIVCMIPLPRHRCGCPRMWHGSIRTVGTHGRAARGRKCLQ